ncbi:hypothetical protein Patl1_24724 [Pistacia atlantica]|uniref:Uncharacterized protein n=1 Tax=Pistacia atlantica TaxID=434234 RepID=A0ACC1AZN6_9ROSI|nr:hypothetical protein Patl1_24724 [Pistacia atlantica]
MYCSAEIMGNFKLSSLSMAILNSNSFRNPVGFFNMDSLNTTPRIPATSLKCGCSNSSSNSTSVEVFSVTSSSKYDVDYLGQSTKGDLNLKLDHLQAFGLDGQITLDGPIEEVARIEAEEADNLLTDLGIPVL